MALSILEAQERMRKAMLRRDQQTLRELTKAYRTAYGYIKRDAERLLDKITRAQEAGESVSPFWLSQEERYRSLLIQVQKRINAFSDQAAGKISAAQADLVTMGSKDALALIAARFPPEIAASFDLLPSRAIEQLVGVLSDGSPLADLLGELGPQARELISRSLVQGVAAGMPIRRIAQGIDSALGHNLTRALNISRTESLRAYREASRQTYIANQDIVTGWVWLCSFSARTCPACFAMHGSEHSNNETLQSHCQCRCVMSPRTRSWRDLGISLDEPSIDYGDAESWLHSQPAAVQQQIFGRAGYEAFRDGKVQLSDFVGEKIHPRWGTTRYVRPINEILGTQRQRAA